MFRPIQLTAGRSSACFGHDERAAPGYLGEGDEEGLRATWEDAEDRAEAAAAEEGKDGQRAPRVRKRRTLFSPSPSLSLASYHPHCLYLCSHPAVHMTSAAWSLSRSRYLSKHHRRMAAAMKEGPEVLMATHLWEAAAAGTSQGAASACSLAACPLRILTLARIVVPSRA